MNEKKSPTQKALTNNLRLLALEHDTTAVDLSKGIGISRASLFKYMEGNTSPGADALAKIADYFGVTTDWLLGRSKARSISEDIQTAVKVTGLTEGAIEKLRGLDGQIFGRRVVEYRNIASAIIESPGFDRLLEDIARYILCSGTESPFSGLAADPRLDMLTDEAIERLYLEWIGDDMKNVCKSFSVRERGEQNGEEEE